MGIILNYVYTKSFTISKMMIEDIIWLKSVYDKKFIKKYNIEFNKYQL